jgi:uncharacterized RDD family membrane protein YckC
MVGPMIPITDPMGNAARDWHGHYAGFGSRLMAYCIDAVIVVVAFYLGIGLTSLFIALATLERPRALRLEDLAWLIAFVGFAWAYFFYFVAVYGKTPGKALLGLRVVSKRGTKLGPIRSCLRAPAYLVSYLGFCLGFVWIMISKERRAWHDHLVGSCVVYDWDARPGARYRAARQRTASL